VTCPAGTHLTGGGGSVTTSHGNVALQATRPNGDGWKASAIRLTAHGDLTVSAFALCAG
jgi:hypothetical protein